MLSVRQCLAENELDRQKSEIILADILRVDKANLLAHPERRLNFWQYFKFLRAKRLLKKGVPLAYITDHKEFFGLDFLVNKNVLIPRPETEMMVEEAAKIILNYKFKFLNQFKNLNNQILIVDVGTGTGCVPISIMKTLKHKNIKTFAIDISGAALKIAKKNAKRHGVDIEFLHGDLLEPASRCYMLHATCYMIITANLPYLTAEQFASEPSIQHEPRRALVADDHTGLSLYEKLCQQITHLLIANCSLLIEIDPRQSSTALALAKKYFPSAKIEIKKDLAGHDRLVLIKIEKSNLTQ
jgi:release factor glutamine methyltransferase